MTPPARYVQRLELASPCSGRARASRCAVDLSALLADAASLSALVDDLFLPFEGGVDAVVALLVQVVGAEDQAEAAAEGEGGHRFSTAVAAAIAGAKQCAYGEVTVLRAPELPAKRSRKRTRADPGTDADVKLDLVDARCERVATVDVAELGLSVELKRRVVTPGSRVLLVMDWVDEVETVMAARDAIIQLGGDVAGVSFVVAASSRLLHILKAAQIPFSCSWTPPFGGELAIGSRRAPSETNPPARRCVCRQPKSGKSQGAGLSALQPELSELQLNHVTAQYQANNPCEDRSLNVISPADPNIQVHAVFDGHGGILAVEHVKSSLCRRILDSISSTSSNEEVKAAVTEAFLKCDTDLKNSLLALAPELRLSKGYCNAGSCAVVALFVGSTLYVANVGDCAAVLGKAGEGNGPTRGIQLSVDHSCGNPTEVRLVTERSRDRHPVRLSKDDQGSNELTLGVKRVAGSLAVTRAFGDFYLKCEELSTAPFKSKVPYITVEPSVAAVELSSNDKFVILASDGLWEVMSSDEASLIVQNFDPNQELFFSSASAALIHAALEKIAHRDGMLIHEVLALPKGTARRRLHDDITCTVIYISQRDDPAATPVMSIESQTSSLEEV